VFINIVFAALFLGEAIPSPREIWRKAASQVAFGQTLAWGQYVVGMLLTIFVLVPVFGLPPIAGALIEVPLKVVMEPPQAWQQPLHNSAFLTVAIWH
jgi:ESS family glutamate:Na+ symporter